MAKLNSILDIENIKQSEILDPIEAAKIEAIIEAEALRLIDEELGLGDEAEEIEKQSVSKSVIYKEICRKSKLVADSFHKNVK